MRNLLIFATLFREMKLSLMFWVKYVQGGRMVDASDHRERSGRHNYIALSGLGGFDSCLSCQLCVKKELYVAVRSS